MGKGCLSEEEHCVREHDVHPLVLQMCGCLLYRCCKSGLPTLPRSGRSGHLQHVGKARSA